MKIKLHRLFEKSYRNRIQPNEKLVLQTDQRIDLFKINSQNSVLKDHALTGAKKDLRSFSVTGDIRIVYLPVSEAEVVFMDIGSHNQVY